MSEKNSYEGVIDGIFTTCIIISIISILVFSYYGIKVKNEEYCSATSYISFHTDSLVDDYYLSSITDYVLEKSSKVNPALYYNFCFHYQINNTNNMRVNVIDEKENVLSSAILLNSSNLNCQIINGDDQYVKQASFIGVKCTGCNSSQGLYLKKDLSGGFTEKIIRLSGITNTSNDNNIMSYGFVGYEDCKSLIKTLFIYYSILMSVLLLIICMMRGFTFLEKEVKT